MKTYGMMVLGCKVNDYEATFVREKMNRYYTEVDFKDKADIYLIFTCCVTNMAEAKTRKFFHQARRNNPDAYIVAIGCLSQIKGDTKDFEDVDLIIGSDNKDKVVDLINEHEFGYKVNKDLKKDFEELFIESYPTKSRSFLKVQDGCNQFCSYCVIPYSRGRERSANHNSIIEQAKILSKTNKEIVLTGIHTGRYNDGEYNLYDLLCALCKIDGLETIRLSSIEITEITDEIVELMKTNSKIAHHLHIPVQSCSNQILKSMNRPYTIEWFKQRVKYIRDSIEDISISTDLIVGFPNESDELFNETINNLKDIEFSFIHVFPYSRKKGTKADIMDNHIDPKVKKERVKKVIELEKNITLNFHNKFINKQCTVLIEKCDDKFSYGYTKEYIYTKINGVFEVGSLVNVIINKVGNEVIADAVI